MDIHYITCADCGMAYPDTCRECPNCGSTAVLG